VTGVQTCALPIYTDLAGSEGLRILESSDGFLSDYAESILTDDGTDDNTLDFAF